MPRTALQAITLFSILACMFFASLAPTPKADAQTPPRRGVPTAQGTSLGSHLLDIKMWQAVGYTQSFLDALELARSRGEVRLPEGLDEKASTLRERLTQLRRFAAESGSSHPTGALKCTCTWYPPSRMVISETCPVHGGRP